MNEETQKQPIKASEATKFVENCFSYPYDLFDTFFYRIKRAPHGIFSLRRTVAITR